MSDLLRGTRAPWFATPVVALAVLVGFNGLTTMIVWGPWLGTAIILMAVVTVAIAATRMLSRSRVLPTLIGAVAAVVVSVPAFARGPEGQVRMLPGPTALRELASAVREGVHVAATTVAPAEINGPLFALIMCGVFAIFLVAEHIAVSWRAAALSGFILIIPWMPAITLQHRVSVSLLLVAIACWVVLLALSKRPTGIASRPSMVSAMAAAGATVALVALVAPPALGGNGWGLIPRFTTPDGLETSTRLNLALDLRNSLTVNSASPVMVYLSTGERPEVFRLYTLTDFNGAQWSLDESKGNQEPVTSVLWTQPVPDWESLSLDRVNVSIQDFVGNHLPLPTVPRTIDAPGGWTYSPSLDVVSSATDNTQWLDYSFSADLDYFDGDNLRALGDASGDDALLGSQYVDLPVDADSDRFVTLAQEITADATTRYDQAFALQEYFRNPQNFTYTTAVDPSGADSVSVFLDAREGYCVQFASGMIMLARALDIPARLAIGFLPGTLSNDGASVVSGGDAHAWPELYFSGAGWVRFEPTPSIQTGARPSYADPAGEPVQVQPGGIPVPTTAPSAAPRPVDQGGAPPPVAGATPTGSVPWPLIIGLIIVAASILIAVSWWLRRKRLEESHEITPETLWSRVRVGLSPDLAWPLSLTPSEAVDHVVVALAAEGVLLPQETLDNFDHISNAVADFRYAPHGTTIDIDRVKLWGDNVVDATRQARGLDSRGRPVRGGVRVDSLRGA